MSRKYTNALLELMDEGVVEPRWLAQALAVWLSEDDVREFMSANFDFEQLSEILGEDLTNG